LNTEALLARFAPVFDRLGETAGARERTRLPPLDEVAELRRLGFGALRLPQDAGGLGASLEQLFALLESLAAADPNLSQALRQHFFHVEMLLARRHTAAGRRWLARVAAGDLFGNATTEPHGTALGTVATRLRRQGAGWRLDGRKIYGTGNLYAHWIPVAATDEEGRAVLAVVGAAAPGVRILDDWDGFGQRLTGTDTTIFEDVFVEADDVAAAPSGEAHHGAGFHQMVLVATLAGIGRAVCRDAVAEVRARSRVYFTGTGELPRHDPIIQTEIGRLAARMEGCSALAAHAAAALGAAWRQWEADAPVEAVDHAFSAAEIAVGMAQIVLSEQVVESCGRLFDCLGASATLRTRGLDRHWRNARTVASHNPPPFKARVVGDFLLNDTPPQVFRAGHDVGEKRG